MTEEEITVKNMMKKIFKDESLTKVQQKDLINKALEIAENSEEYCLIATNISHDEVLSDKSWGKEIFKRALEKVDIEYGTSDIYNLARQISAPEQLNDKIWAKELYESAIEKTNSIDDLITIAYDVSDNEDIYDKSLAKVALEKALKLSSDSSEKLEVAEAIATDEVISDKDWALSVVKSVENDLEHSDDYKQIGILYAHDKLLSDKKNGRIWFEKAIEVESQYDGYDFYELAVIIYDKEVLDDKDWAADLCIGSYKNVVCIQTLINMSKIVYQTSSKQAKEIISYALKLIANNNYSSDDIFNIAAHIADKKLSNLPFFNDKVWGKELFLKAIDFAESLEEKKLIEENMNQYL